MQKRNSLIKNTIIFMLGGFGSKILNFILVPIYTYYVSTEEMGTYDIYITTATLLVPLITISIYDGGYRWLVDEKSDRAVVIQTTLRILFIGVLFFSGIYFLIVNIIKIRYAFTYYLMIVLSCYYGTLSILLRGLKKNEVYALLGIAQTFFTLSLNIIMLIILKLSIYGLILAQTISYFILSVLITLIMRESIFCYKHCVSLKYAEEMIKYSLPLIPNSINWWITNLSDRYMIRFILGNSSNGIYSVSCKFPGVMDSFTGFFSSAWQEDAICAYDSSEKSNHYSAVYRKLYSFVFTIIVPVLPLTYLYVTMFMNSSFQTAWRYVPLLYLGTGFHALANFLSVGYNIKKDTKWVSLTSFFAAITNFLINFAFMGKYGIQIASVSTLVSYFVVFIIRYYTTRDVLQMEIKWGPFAILIIYDVFMCVLIYAESIIIDAIVFICGTIIFLRLNKDIIKKVIILINRKERSRIR